MPTMGPRRSWFAVASMVAGYAVLQWLGRTYGATPDERRRTFPGEEGLGHPDAVTTHAITIDAPPERVWAWLVQIGWGRGQWYTARWVDRLLFPNNGPSAERLVPELQKLEVGDRVLDGPPELQCSFIVEQVVPNQSLVLRSGEHLPPGWAEKGGSIDWVWSFLLDDLQDGRTRFLFRSRFRLAPLWVRAFYIAVIIPADFVMSRQMLRGVRERAERTRQQDLDLVRSQLRPVRAAAS
jgi:hypothetical protein